jgi:hypothetical protein
MLDFGGFMSLAGLGTKLLNLGSSRRADKRQWAAYQQQLKQSQGQFDAQMDTSVQRRVADAKKAGIHPLFAMGASVGASPTLSAGQVPSGRGVTDAISGLAEAMGTIDLNRANAESARSEARRNEAEAAYLDSRRAMLGQDLASRGRDGAGVKTYPLGTKPGPEVVFGPAEYFNPQVATSKRIGVESGTHPGSIDVITPDGRTVNIPAPNIGLDEIAQLDYVYQRAIHKGSDYMMAIRKWMKKNIRKPRGTAGGW